MILQIGYMFAIFLSLLIGSGLAFIFIKNKKANAAVSIAIFALIASLSGYALFTSTNITTIIFHLYPFSDFFLFLFSIVFIFVDLLAYRYSEDFGLFSLLLSLSALGVYAVASANSIITIFIGIELSSIATTFMILSDNGRRLEAAVKLFIMSALAVSFIAFALALLFPYNGQLSLNALSSNSLITGDYLIILSAVLFAIGLGTEAGVFPFNFWVPDVYEGSPGHITALLAGINKNVALVALLEIFFLVFVAFTVQVSHIFFILAIVTMFFGNLLAMVQKSVKRILAFSSISQIGYILIGFAAATQYGIESAVFQIFAHTFMIVGAFAIVMWLEASNLKTVDDYTGLMSRNSIAAISLTILMLSMAGIPPLMGFFGKFLLFSSAVNSNMVSLAIIGILNSFISMYYYSKIMLAIFSDKDHKKIRIDKYVAIVALSCVAIIVIFGIFPGPIISIAKNVASFV